MSNLSIKVELSLNEAFIEHCHRERIKLGAQVPPEYPVLFYRLLTPDWRPTIARDFFFLLCNTSFDSSRKIDTRGYSVAVVHSQNQLHSKSINDDIGAVSIRQPHTARSWNGKPSLLAFARGLV
jgi:hypothetical protein